MEGGLEVTKKDKALVKKSAEADRGFSIGLISKSE